MLTHKGLFFDGDLLRWAEEFLLTHTHLPQRVTREHEAAPHLLLEVSLLSLDLISINLEGVFKRGSVGSDPKLH